MKAPLAALAALALLAPLLGGCGGDPFDDYCEAVAEHQTELTEITTSGERGALLKALPIYRELRAEAPSDITDEWQVVITSLTRLQQALDDARGGEGVDASTYDPKDPPDGVTAEERDAIAAAADEVGSTATAEALRSVEQQARDVCQTPLTL